MAFETFLSIASFAISLGGLVPILFLKNRRKDVALAVIITALIATTGGALYRLHQHNRLIGHVQDEIIAKMSHNTWTLDHLYQELHYVPFTVLNEALFQAVERGIVGHRVIEFRGPDGAVLQVRGYYVEASRGSHDSR